MRFSPYRAPLLKESDVKERTWSSEEQTQSLATTQKKRVFFDLLDAEVRTHVYVDTEDQDDRYKFIERIVEFHTRLGEDALPADPTEGLNTFPNILETAVRFMDRFVKSIGGYVKCIKVTLPPGLSQQRT